MKPFFSPLVKEKVRLYFVNNKELTPTRVYVEKYLSLLSKYQDIKATDCTEEITYLLTLVMDEVVKIQQYTTLNRSHVLNYLLIMHYELSDSEVMTQFLAEEEIIKEEEEQKKATNVVSWEALMDNLQMVDKEHLDAFHSYFSKIATKYTQDNEKLRSNLDKLTQQIEECKKKYVPTIHKTINIDKVEQMVDCIEHQEIH